MVDINDKLCWGRSVGVYLSSNRITISEVGSTLTGKKVLKQDTVKYDTKGPGCYLKDILEKHLSQRQRKSVPVSIGLGPEQTFFITCLCNFEQNEKPSLKDLLEASRAGSALEPDQIVADYYKISKLKLMGNQLWTLAACRYQLATELFTSVQNAEVQNVRLQPSPLSLLLTQKKHRSKKKWKVAISVFLHIAGGLAVLEIDGKPLIWREFVFSPEERSQKIKSAIRTIQAHSATSLNNPVIEGIILQGKDASGLVETLIDDLGMDVTAIDEEGYTDTQCSHSLALLAKKNNEQANLDLFRTLRDKPGIMDMFPWKRAISVALAVACMGFMMWQKLTGLTNQYNSLRRQNAEYKWSKGKRTGEISNERKQLLTEVEAVSKFLSSRVIWSDYLRDLPTRLPMNACLTNIWGVSEMKEMNKKKQGRKEKRSLTLRGITKFAEGIAAPQEIEVFLDSLRNVKLLRRDFPQVQLAEIKWRREGTSDIAMFTVVALPKKKTGSEDKK